MTIRTTLMLVLLLSVPCVRADTQSPEEQAQYKKWRAWIDVLRDPKHPNHYAAPAAIGSDILYPLVRDRTEAIQPLIKALKSDDPVFRASVAGALGRVGDARALKPLIRTAQDTEANVRASAVGGVAAIVRRALHAGGQADSDAVACLTAALTDSDGAVRAAGAEGLGNVNHTAVREAVGGCLRDADPRVRLAAAQSLAILSPGAEAPPVLGDILRKDKPAIRVAAARALGLACGYPDRIPLLVEALKDPDAWVRESAATALGAYPDPAALPHLLAALDDTQPKVCQSAVESLRKYGPNAVGPLMARVRAVRPEHPTPEFEVLAGLPPALIEKALARDLASPEPALRLLAMRLAAYISSAQGPKPMPEVLHSIAANLKDAQADIRAGAADALGCMHAVDRLPILAEAVTNDPAATVRAAAATAIGYTWRDSWFTRSLSVHPCPPPDTRGLDSLLTAVADKDPDVRLASLRALEFLVDGKIMPLRLEAIMGVMDDPRTDVRVAAARVLVRCPSALQKTWAHAVERGLRNDQWQVRREWTEVLGQYGYPQAMACAKDPAEHAEVRLAAIRGIERGVQDGKSNLKAPQYRLSETLNSIWADASSPADVRSAAKNVWYNITPCAAARANSQEMTP